MDDVRSRRSTALTALEQRMVADTTLPLTSNVVFGEGDPHARVVIIGEAPGAKEDELRRPFVGRSGMVVERLLEEVGWPRSSVYITNIVKRRPPDNRDPLPEEIAAYRPYLAEQLAIINPPIIATFGRFAMNYFLPMGKMTRDNGRIFCVAGRCIVPFFHPAAGLRSPTTMAALRTSFLTLPRIVELCEAYVRDHQAPSMTSLVSVDPEELHLPLI